MNDFDGGATPRRQFLEQLAATTVGLGVAGRMPPVVAPPADTAAARPVRWDDSWTRRLGKQHRFVIDIADLDRAASQLGLATELLSWYHTALNTRDSDLHIVVVMRHRAIPMVFNDAIWAKYHLGEDTRSKESATSDSAERNPFVRVVKDDKVARVDSDNAIDALQRRGIITLGCNMAVQSRASQIARATNQDVDAVRRELVANLLPGVILQLNGVYAVTRAQDAGCVLYKGANG